MPCSARDSITALCWAPRGGDDNDESPGYSYCTRKTYGYKNYGGWAVGKSGRGPESGRRVAAPARAAGGPPPG